MREEVTGRRTVQPADLILPRQAQSTAQAVRRRAFEKCRRPERFRCSRRNVADSPSSHPPRPGQCHHPPRDGVALGVRGGRARRARGSASGGGTPTPRACRARGSSSRDDLGRAGVVVSRARAFAVGGGKSAPSPPRARLRRRLRPVDAPRSRVRPAALRRARARRSGRRGPVRGFLDARRARRGGGALLRRPARAHGSLRRDPRAVAPRRAVPEPRDARRASPPPAIEAKDGRGRARVRRPARRAQGLPLLRRPEGRRERGGCRIPKVRRRALPPRRTRPRAPLAHETAPPGRRPSARASGGREEIDDFQGGGGIGDGRGRGEADIFHRRREDARGPPRRPRASVRVRGRRRNHRGDPRAARSDSRLGVFRRVRSAHSPLGGAASIRARPRGGGAVSAALRRGALDVRRRPIRRARDRDRRARRREARAGGGVGRGGGGCGGNGGSSSLGGSFGGSFGGARRPRAPAASSLVFGGLLGSRRVFRRNAPPSSPALDSARAPRGFGRARDAGSARRVRRSLRGFGGFGRELRLGIRDAPVGARRKNVARGGRRRRARGNPRRRRREGAQRRVLVPRDRRVGPERGGVARDRPRRRSERRVRARRASDAAGGGHEHPLGPRRARTRAEPARGAGAGDANRRGVGGGG